MRPATVFRPIRTGDRLGERVLLTGGAGYVGSHTAKTLAQGGYEPVVLDGPEFGHADAVKWSPLVVADIRDLPRLGQPPRQRLDLLPLAVLGHKDKIPDTGCGRFERVLRQGGIDDG